MNKSDLPILKDQNRASVSRPAPLEIGKIRRTNRTLLASGVVLLGGAIGVFILTKYTVFSIVLSFLGVAVLIVRQLIQKSLGITASQSFVEISSVEGRLDEIKKQVGKSKFLEKVENEGSRLASQADQLLRQHRNLMGVLCQKFEVTELTHSRYADGIEKSCLALGENLLHAKNILENLDAIEKSDSGHWKKQMEPVNELLNINDQALEGLAALFNSINEINTKEKYRPQLEESMDRIRELAERVNLYSKR